MKTKKRTPKTQERIGQSGGGFKSLVRYLTDYKLQIGIILLLAVFSTLFSIVGPKVLSLATDELAGGLLTNLGVNFSYIGKVLLGLLCIYLLSAAFSALMGFLMAGLSSSISHSLRKDMMAKINRLPVSYFHKNSHGDTLSRMTNDIDTISQALNQSLTQIITSVVTVIGVSIMMLTISWKLTFVVLFTVPLSLLLVSGIAKKSQKYYAGQRKYLGSVNGHVEEMYSGHLVLKAFNGEAESLQQFERENVKLVNASWKAEFLSGMMMPIITFVGNLGYVAVCLIGAIFAAAGTMTIGGIQAFIQYVRSFTQPITQIANITNQIQQLIAASDRVFSFLQEEEEQKDDIRMNAQRANIKGDVLFDHVRFGYEDSDLIVINDFSVSVRAGQKVAIVGPTGAGKSTLIKLLMRFHELRGGSIFVDGYNINSFERQDLRSQFGMVLQETWLFGGTIRDNIRYGRLEATDEEIIAAAKAAHVDHFIRTLPQGYDTVINEEMSNISQGQKQLLTIARAILANGKILILDEATSSVDTRTEQQIQKAMDNLTWGRTSFIIAHRLSTIRNADLILCMKDGDIVEQGTHEELIEKNAFYADLYNSQFEKTAPIALTS